MDESELYTYYDEENKKNETCEYLGTDDVEIKIYLIGVFGTFIALVSIAFNTFFTLVFIRNKYIRRSSVFYFGILAVIDTIMAVNYIAVMSLPVYMDYYHYLPMYHLFLSYFRIVLTESNCAMFASLLLIILATTERLLRTFDGKTVLSARRFLEKNRPMVSLFCILVAIGYKLCLYWEIDVHYKYRCLDGFSQYEIIPGYLAVREDYRFYWMFLTRNILDRIIPFIALVAMNYLIIKALKRDFKRLSAESKISDSYRDSKASRGSVRDATRALISLVSMYLMSQSLQVLLTVGETFAKEFLTVTWETVYSYLNDIVSILTLLSSCLRFPVYCSCNQLIFSASSETIRDLISICFGEEKKPNKEYQPITVRHTAIRIDSKCSLGSPGSSAELDLPEEITRVTGAVYNDKLREWQL